MNDITPTAIERLALSQAMSDSQGNSAAKRGLLKGVTGIAYAADDANVPLCDILQAYAAGTSRQGDKILMETLSVMTHFLTSWGVLALLALSFYTLAQAASGLAKKLWGGLKKIVSMLSPVGALKEITAKIFHDEAAEADPSTAIALVGSMIAARVPMFGIMTSALSQISSDAYDNGSPLPVHVSNRRTGDRGPLFHDAYDEANVMDQDEYDTLHLDATDGLETADATDMDR
jgi:hypothetical protein